jgi:hypothetical protein
LLGLGQKFNEYRKYLQIGTKDKTIAMEDWSFNVGKREHDYVVKISVEFTVSPKNKNEKQMEIKRRDLIKIKPHF